MSPEQVLNEEVTARSDIYGLGVTAFFAFSGRFPFEGQSATEILAKQVAQPAPPLASLGMGVPRKLGLLIDRCLAKEPAERPASADALAEQLGVAMEQRRELPAALRAFVRRSGRMNGGGTLLYASALLGASSVTSAVFGVAEGFAIFIAGAAIAPVVFAVTSARRLARMGFAHADLAPAFRSELENAREEHAVEHGFGRSVLEKTLSRVAGVLGSYALAAGPLIAVGLQSKQWHDTAEMALPVTGLTASIAVIAGLAYLATLQGRRDVDTEFWALMWQGRLGTLAFAVARKLRPGRQVSAAMTHRATELSLGMAAEQLYESLPKEVRQSIGDLPTLLARLQRDAQALRARHDELNDALTRLSTITAADDYENLRAERTLVHEKLRDAVGAMETIRLNLLRLHAGSATVEGVTTHLQFAADISAEVERLIAARHEVDERLRLPRSIAATPV